MSLKFPEDVKLILKRKYANNYYSWSGSSDFSLKIVLGKFTEKEAISYGQKFHKWIEQWKVKLPGELIWEEYNWKILGKQSLPTSLLLKNPRDIALWIDEINHWDSFDRLKKCLPVEHSQISPKLLNKIHESYGNQVNEVGKLLSVVTWLLDNRRSNLYARQLPIEGIDSKWVERNKDLVTKFLIEKNTPKDTDNDFYSISGLRPLPTCIRVRVLDPRLAAKVSGISDLSITHDELLKLDLGAKRVLLVENLQSGLSLGFLPQTIAIMGMGNGVSLLTSAPWINSARVYYWGDIDTYGLAILNQLRFHLPKCESILMDELTLLQNILYKSEEIKQYSSTEMINLTLNERTLYEGLKSQKWGLNFRLEQERIPWKYVWSAIQAIFEKEEVL